MVYSVQHRPKIKSRIRHESGPTEQTGIINTTIQITNAVEMHTNEVMMMTAAMMKRLKEKVIVIILPPHSHNGSSGITLRK